MKQTQQSLVIDENTLVIDVRTPAEFAGGANPKSRNIPLQDLQSHLSSLDPNQSIIVCCASGGRSAHAAQILKQNGFKDVVNAGPWRNTLC